MFQYFLNIIILPNRLCIHNVSFDSTLELPVELVARSAKLSNLQRGHCKDEPLVVLTTEHFRAIKCQFHPSRSQSHESWPLSHTNLFDTGNTQNGCLRNYKYTYHTYTHIHTHITQKLKIVDHANVSRCGHRTIISLHNY